MKIISEQKFKRLENLSNKDGVIAALAIDQRGAFEKMMPGIEGEERTSKIKEYKNLISEHLTPYASSILLDPVYGLDAINKRDKDAGLLMAYEITGYRDDYRLLDLTENLSVKRIKEIGADAVKILLYYDADDTEENNDKKRASIERVGSECLAEDMPFFLEILTYDNKIKDQKSKEFAKVKPHKVLSAIKEFSKEQYNVDVLKLEVPVNMNYVEGFSDDYVYTREEALKHFKDQSDNTNLPILYLSAGVSAELFQDTLRFANEAVTEFHGVLCGRATWAGGVDVFLENKEDGIEWIKTTGKDNIESLNKVINETCKSWKEKLGTN